MMHMKKFSSCPYTHCICASRQSADVLKYQPRLSPQKYLGYLKKTKTKANNFSLIHLLFIFLIFLSVQQIKVKNVH